VVIPGLVLESRSVEVGGGRVAQEGLAAEEEDEEVEVEDDAEAPMDSAALSSSRRGVELGEMRSALETGAGSPPPQLVM
jgi:hypothetical protein